jgi:hypothetical protein
LFGEPRAIEDGLRRLVQKLASGRVLVLVEVGGAAEGCGVEALRAAALPGRGIVEADAGGSQTDTHSRKHFSFLGRCRRSDITVGVGVDLALDVSEMPQVGPAKDDRTPHASRGKWAAAPCVSGICLDPDPGCLGPGVGSG